MEDLLLHPDALDPSAQQALLSDNRNRLTPPTNQDVLKTVTASHLYAAPGTDGIPSFLYKECWSQLGGPLTDVMGEVFQRKPLPLSMRTSLMVFGSKPKKTNS